MPHHAPQVKIDAVTGYGARIVFCEQSARESTVKEIQAESGAVVIHPFDNAHVVAGQGTATLEFVDQVPDLDTIVAPIGGGGLLSGASLVGMEHGVDVVGAEPEIVDDAYRSLRDGIRYGPTGRLSVGDGLLTGIGEIAFEILHAHDRRVLTVSEAEMLEMVAVVATRMKLLIEPSAGTAPAAVVRYRSQFASSRVGIIISGGNIALEQFAVSGDR
jgi:threonine dehydratase